MVETMNTHVNAEASRDGKWWLVYVKEVDHYTQARNLAEAKLMAQDLTAMMLDIPLASVDVTLTVEVPEPAKNAVRQAESLFQQAAKTRHEAAAKSREAAEALRAQGWTLRDIGEALGVSYQRAHQLVAA